MISWDDIDCDNAKKALSKLEWDFLISEKEIERLHKFIQDVSQLKKQSTKQIPVLFKGKSDEH